MRYALSIALGLAVLALTALIITLALSQQHVRQARAELARANEQLVQNRDAADQLEQIISNLKADLEAAHKARTELKENLDQSTSDAEQLRKDVATAQLQVKDEEGRVQELNAELADANGERDKTKNHISELTQVSDQLKTKLSEAEKQVADLKMQLATTTDQLANAKQETEQANAKIAEMETSANETKSLQTQLEQANAQIDRLNGELAQKTAPPVSVSPPGAAN